LFDGSIYSCQYLLLSYWNFPLVTMLMLLNISSGAPAACAPMISSVLSIEALCAVKGSASLIYRHRNCL
jgi:hypothetical protein